MKLNELKNATLLKLEREPYRSKVDNQVYYSYFVRGTFRGREKLIDVIPMNNIDTEGKSEYSKQKILQERAKSYEVLSDVFGNENIVDLVAYENVMDNGKKYSSYIAFYDDGVEQYTCPVKPAAPSARQLMETFVKNTRRRLALEREEELKRKADAEQVEIDTSDAEQA